MIDPVMLNIIKKEIQNKVNQLNSKLKTYSQTASITANDTLELNLIDNGFNGLNAVVEVLMLDNDENSDTYNTYISTSNVIKSISNDGETLTIYNISDKDIKVLIKIIQIN
jgi:hypothetical protein